MSSNLYNKALRNIKLKDNINKVSCTENEINENLKKSFHFELKNLTKSIELKKLFPSKLYEFLIKYENNLPPTFFYKYSMELGDVLLRNGYFMIARNQCYERYLMKIHNLDLLSIDQNNLSQYLNLDQEEKLESTVSAIFGFCLAEFRCIEAIDCHFESKTNQQQCQVLLRIYQRVMEIILKYEKYCWLIYNGTVCIYWICEILIRCGCSLMVVEPLMWASCCLETSIPLLTIPNLKWRAVIYTATCQALFNIQYDADAEAFARRALVKINELHGLYEMSSEPRTSENAMIICEAVIKMGVMIFKRNAFETRRRPKTYLRPKTKINFKEVLQNNWPRTGTERILAEMFDSPSQQILAILEAVKQPSRTIGKIEPAASENDWEMLDVYSELFYAAVAIITGRSQFSGKADKMIQKEYKIVDVDPESSQLTLAVQNGSSVSIESAFELVCWAFSYGNWEFIDCISNPLLSLIKDSKYLTNKLAMENMLNLFSLMRKITHSSVYIEKKAVKLTDQFTDENKNKQGELQTTSRTLQRSNSSVSKETKSSKSRKDNSTTDEEDKTKYQESQDPICQLTNFIESILDNKFDPKDYYQEILVEAGLILWTKCKSVFQSTQDGSLSTEFIKPISNIGKWIRVLYISQRVLSLTNYAKIHSVSYAEISMRLALLLEQLAVNGWISGAEISNDENVEEYSLTSFIALLKTDSTSNSGKCISAAKQILKTSIDQLNKARNLQNMTNEQNNQENYFSIAESLDDLYLEINSIYLRICAREVTNNLYIISNESKSMVEIRKSTLYKEALQICNKNVILLAIFQAHLGNLLKNNLSPADIAELINHVKALLEKSENNLSDIKTFSHSKEYNENNEKLPPPIVEKKGNDYIIVKLDSNLNSQLKSKIGWVRLYARAVDTPNAEVRLTDDKLSGTGMETSCLSTKFTIYNLTANQQYILAFSAYDKFGSPIGRGIGHSTKYILATDKINPVCATAIIAQIIFEINLKEEVIWFENLLWAHFVEPIPECNDEYQKTNDSRSIIHNEYNIKSDLLKNSSSMLLRQFCLVVLSSVVSECKLRGITNDINAKSHSQIEDQMNRLRLSDKLLTLFVISKKLKDNLLTMEIFASVACLMAPIMNHNQFYKPFSEILIICVNTLHGLPQTTWIKIPVSFKCQIHHLLASIGFYLSKCMNKYQYDVELSESIRHSITILLQMSGNSPFTVTDQEDAVNKNGTSSQIDEPNDKVPTNSQKKGIIKGNRNDNLVATITPQQSAFELFKFSLAKQNIYDHQLTGNEEPDILMAYISNLPSRMAYKEVSKFSRKTRYLQFIVEILNKAIIEGNFDNSLNYYKEIKEWLRKRNEAVLGKPLLIAQSQREGNKAVISDKDMFSRSVVTHEDVEDSKRPPKPKRKTKYKAINILPNMNDTQRQIQEQAELKALEVLSTTFVSMYKQNIRRKKFRQISEYERAARIRMTNSMGMGYLGIAYAKIDAFIQLLNGGLRLSEIPEIQDVTRFMLDGTGKILPLEEFSVIDDGVTVLKTTKQQNPRQTDTPRTFRSDINLTDKRIFVEAPKLLSQFSDSFSKAASVLKRSIVLANRGKNWLLLSNACSLSWYCLSLCINTFCRLSKFLNLARKEYPDIDWSSIQLVSLNSIYKSFSTLFYFGSDAILDMIGIYKQNYPNKTFKHFDENFLENFVLRSLHLLFETGSYEKSIHIILRFTKLTNYQFVNITHPILINSQEQLCRKAADNQARNPDWTVEICRKYINQSILDMKSDCIDSSNYQEFLFKRHSGLLSLKKLYQQKSKIINQVQQLGNENSHIQNLLQILKSEASSILIFSVPVDINVSIKEWQKYQFEKSPKKSWMELYHKKNYFYFTHNPNLEFNKKGSKLTLQELLNSYKELLDESLSNNNLEHYSLALRDMGNLYINHLQKPNLALPLWNESLDCIFNQKQAVKSIINSTDNEPTKYTFQMEKNLSKFGAINCLVIGSLLTKICRLDDVNYDERIKICLQAATFFKAVYSSSFSHPEHDLSYLDHPLFLDSSISTPLIPKLNLFANSSLIDIQDLESQLFFLINLLMQTEYYQFLISLLALYEHLVYTFCRNSTKAIEVQIIKLKISIKLRRFSTASRLIFQLFSGDKLPQITDSRPAPPITKTPTNTFDDQKQINDENNLMVLDKILSKRINTNFSQKIGSSLTNKISLLQAEFLMELSACIPVAAEILNPKIYSSTEASVMSSKKQTLKKSEMLVNQIEEEFQSLLESVASNTQRSSWTQISLPVLKGLLLQVSSSIIQPIIDDYIGSIQKEDLEYLKMNVYQVENVIYGLMLQSKNFRLRFFNRSGARLSMFACCLLRDYYRESVNSDNKFARTISFLNIFTHIKCNQELIQCMLGELSVGNILDISDMAISDVPAVQELIMSCIEECDQNNLYQHKAWFVAALAQYALITGYEIDKYREILSEGIEILNSEYWLSDASENVLIDCKLRSINANISSNNVQTYNTIKQAENSLRRVHGHVLELIDSKYPQSVFWSTIDCDLSFVQIYNVYDWKYVYLSKINLLFGAILMLKTQFNEEKNLMRVKALSILNIGLDLCRSVSRREPWVEAEFLLMIGRIQRSFIISGKISHSTAISTLVEGLKLSLGSTGHLGMRKQFFLELSITFMICSRMLDDSVIFDGEIIDAAKLLTSAQTVQALQNQKVNKTEALNFRRLSWLAIKCATNVSDSLQNLNFYKSDSSKFLSQDAQNNFPNSALFDLFGRYILGNKRIIFKNEIEEELSRMPESRVPRDNEQIDDQIEKIRSFLNKATLSQILAYQELLLKLTNNIFLSKSEDFELKIKPLTRCIFNDDLLFEKEFEIHKFLHNYVQDYKMKCSVPIPKDISNFTALNTLEGVGDNILGHFNKSLWNSIRWNEEEETVNSQQFIKMNIEYPVDILLKIEIKERLPVEKMDVNETEIFMHFYESPFEFNLHSQSKSMLIYASTKKVLKSVNKLESVLTGWLLIPSQDIFPVYRDIQESAQLLEILSNTSEPTSTSKSSESSKKQISSSTNASSSKQSKVNNQQLTLSMGSEISAIEIKIRQTFDKISSWIIKTPTTLFSVPNDILIKSTEHTFTVSTSGCIINPIPFDLTKENIRSLSNALNPILSKMINNNALLTKFIQDMFKIDF